MYTMKEWAGLVIKQAREELGYTQQYVADEADIDIRTLKKIEEAESDPYFDTLAKLIRISGLQLTRQNTLFLCRMMQGSLW